MKQLLWKDLQLNAPILVFFGVVIALIYGVGVVTQIHSTWSDLPSATEWGEMLVSYGTITLLLTCCFTGLLGGHAIACERGDRTVHFLATLPPTKTQIIASKLIVAAGATAIIWGLILISLWIVVPRLTSSQTNLTGTITCTGAAALCTLTFGVGWLGTSFMEKSIIPIILGVSSPALMGLAMVMISDALAIPRFQLASWSNPICFICGTLAFVSGIWLFYRRIEP